MSITRRIFLRSTASAGAALATVSAPIVAEAAQSEDPRILEIGRDLPALVAEFDAAAADVERARIVFEATKPALSSALVQKGHAGAGLAEQEWNFEFKTLYPEEKGRPPRRIYRADAIRRFHGDNFERSDAHSQLMKHLHGLAEQYEAAWEKAHHDAELPAVLQRRAFASDALRRVASEVGAIEPHSLTGLVIKARTIEAFARCGSEERQWAMHSHGRTFAGDILAVFGSEVPA